MKKRIEVESLYPGLCAWGELFDRSGTVLIKADDCLSEDDCVRIKEHSGGGVYGDSWWPDTFTVEHAESVRTDAPPGRAETNTLPDTTEEDTGGDSDPDGAIRVESLHPGMRLPRHVYAADSNVLLLAAGVEVTSRFLELLSARGIKMVELRSTTVEQEEDNTLQSQQTRELDAVLEEVLKKEVPLCEWGPDERPQLTLADLKAEAQRGIEQHSRTSNAMAQMCGSLKKGERVVGHDIREAVGGFARQTALDVDLLPMIVSLQRTQGEYLYDHCVNVALIAMSMAAQAGMDRSYIMEIGFGAMLQDIGMLRVPDEIRLAPRSLSGEEFFEVQRHPVLTLDWLEKVKGVPIRAGFIGYQSHERADGQGYPRRRAPMLVHLYAKIVAVADSFVAMMRARPYRPPIGAYETAKAILEDNGKFDRTAVRLLLDTVGLFPVGSFVELDNGIQGKVTRATPGRQTRPVIEELAPGGKLSGELIDLSKETGLNVARAIELPDTALAGTQPSSRL